MRAVVQRVAHAAVVVDQNEIAAIQTGLLILLGVGHTDSATEAQYLAEKIANLRIFEDAAGKNNLSLLDVSGAALVVSQFTLYADTRKGRRPSFVDAAHPEQASPLVDKFAEFLQGQGVPTQQGAFGAHMQISLLNDGPMTIILERNP